MEMSESPPLNCYRMPESDTLRAIEIGRRKLDEILVSVTVSTFFIMSKAFDFSLFGLKYHMHPFHLK
jgi:hypothetical protein